MRKIMVEVSKEDWKKAKDYKRYRNLKRPGMLPVSSTCPIAQCLRRNGYQEPNVRPFSVDIRGGFYQLNAHGILIVSAFDNNTSPMYGTVVLSR